MSVPRELSALQRLRLSRFGCEESVDVHCHVLPGVDDGPAGLDDSLALCRTLVRDGITAAIATPHQLGRYDGQNVTSDIRQRVSELQSILYARRIPLKLAAGGEVRIDERIAKLLAGDQIGTLADNGRYLLLELPSGVAIDAESVLSHLSDIKPRVVLAHSERYQSLCADPEQAEEWVRRGAALQVNAGAVVGAFGAPSQSAALHWVSRGWVSLIATDAHSVGTRRPRMTDAIDAIQKQFGHDVARCVCVENPLRIWKGEPLLDPPVPPASDGRA